MSERPGRRPRGAVKPAFTSWQTRAGQFAAEEDGGYRKRELVQATPDATLDELAEEVMARNAHR